MPAQATEAWTYESMRSQATANDNTTPKAKPIEQTIAWKGLKVLWLVQPYSAKCILYLQLPKNVIRYCFQGLLISEVDFFFSLQLKDDVILLFAIL